MSALTERAQTPGASPVPRITSQGRAMNLQRIQVDCLRRSHGACNVTRELPPLVFVERESSEQRCSFPSIDERIADTYVRDRPGDRTKMKLYRMNLRSCQKLRENHCASETNRHLTHRRSLEPGEMPLTAPAKQVVGPFGAHDSGLAVITDSEQ
jgi:hypothetical protein